MKGLSSLSRLSVSNVTVQITYNMIKNVKFTYNKMCWSTGVEVGTGLQIINLRIKTIEFCSCAPINFTDEFLHSTEYSFIIENVGLMIFARLFVSIQLCFNQNNFINIIYLIFK